MPGSAVAQSHTVPPAHSGKVPVTISHDGSVYHARSQCTGSAELRRTECKDRPEEGLTSSCLQSPHLNSGRRCHVPVREVLAGFVGKTQKLRYFDLSDSAPHLTARQFCHPLLLVAESLQSNSSLEVPRLRIFFLSLSRRDFGLLYTGGSCSVFPCVRT